MDSDERFKHLGSDPRFKILRKKQRKVKIDDRFKSMFTDEKFTLKYSKDKRGRNQKKTSGDDLKKYYSLEEEDKEVEQKSDRKDEDHKKNTKSKQPDQDSDPSEDEGSVEDISEHNSEEEQANAHSDADLTDSDSEVSSSSDESESEAEDPDLADFPIDEIKYDWKPLDDDAVKADEVYRRIAIQNLDWDNLDVRDIYTLVNSVRPPISVKIYISEFGKERLAKEMVHGPEEIVEMPKEDEIEAEYNELKEKMRMLKNQGSSSNRFNEYEDADEEMNPKNQEVRERIRRYQLNRMKYYYAVVEFDSIESAEVVYKELDGMEYEGSSLELDLRFIPDDVEFNEEDVKAECNKLPDLATYKAPLFINTALQQTTVKFTWDETDNKRQDKLRRAYTKAELERDDLEAYLASETESESDEVDPERSDAISVTTANSEARTQKYKQLLKSLEAEEEAKKKGDVDVEWGNFSDQEQNVGPNSDDASDSDFPEDSDVDDMSSEAAGDIDGEDEVEYDEVHDDDDDDDEDEDEEEEAQVRKANKKFKATKTKKAKRKRDAEVEERDQELDLLVTDINKKNVEFNFNPDDDRFKAVYESGVYNIDPSHPNFKRTDAFNLMAERKRQRRMKAQAR